MYNTGDLKSLGLLWTNLAITSYSEWISERDIQTFTTRLNHEGQAFLTTVLPTLGKALDNYHSTGEWVPPPDFKTQREWIHLKDPEKGTLDVCIPIFLGSAIESALDGDSSAVDCVRQLSYIFYKLEVNYDESTKQQFLDRFVKTDHDLADSINFEDVYTSKLVDEMRRMIFQILCNEDPRDIRPCHGGGATACRTSNSEKWHKVRYYPQLDAVFPYSEYFYFSATHLVDELQELEASQELSPTARVCLVPKDSRGPRIISCEPAELLYIQQGLMKKLYRALEASSMTAGQINFTDQSINQELARTSSIDGVMATLDLSDASDRVSWALVQRIFPPVWVEALGACRSKSTILPDGRVVELNKFAPMGSSCCFPVEALVFWAGVRAAIRLQDPNCSKEPVYVYGDDIIVRSTFYECAVGGLESIGLIVNRSKSFFKGPFRESCGGEYHLGIDVTPCRVRKFLERQGSGLATNADLVNSFIAKFGEDRTLILLDIIEEAQGYIFPRSLNMLPCTIQMSSRACNDVFFRRRWNKYLQRDEHRVLALTSTNQKVHPPNWRELLRKELSRDVAVSGKYTHPLAISDSVLEPGYYTDSHSVRTKWQWTWLG